jgi:dethiobiotin synthase
VTRQVAVGGPQRGCGKTLLVLGLLRLLSKRGKNAAAWKPVDTGWLQYNADDLPSDAERFQACAELPEHISLLNPYLFNSTLPPQLAAQRDGVRIVEKTLAERHLLLSKRYAVLLSELPPGVNTPLAEGLTVQTLLNHWTPTVCWVTDFSEPAVEQTLLAIPQLQASGCEVCLWLNNRDDERDGDLIQFQWLRLEETLGLRAWGMMPYFRNGLEDVEVIAEALESQLEPERMQEFEAWQAT